MKKRKFAELHQQKKEREEEKKEEAAAIAAKDESVIGDCVGNLLAAASTRRKSCFVVFFFFLCFFLRNLSSSSSLVLFLFPYKSLCSRSEIIRSPSYLCSSLCSFISFSFLLDLIITSYQCIGQNSPEKLKQKETVRTSKTDHGSKNRTVQPRFARIPAFFT